MALLQSTYIGVIDGVLGMIFRSLHFHSDLVDIIESGQF